MGGGEGVEAVEGVGGPEGFVAHAGGVEFVEVAVSAVQGDEVVGAGDEGEAGDAFFVQGGDLGCFAEAAAR